MKFGETPWVLLSFIVAIIISVIVGQIVIVNLRGMLGLISFFISFVGMIKFGAKFFGFFSPLYGN